MLNFNHDQQSVTGVTNMNLAKTVAIGERINLSKTVGTAVTKYAIGLAWNEKPGIVADCDISAVLLGEDKKVVPGVNGPNMPKCLAYYGQLELEGVKSYGDNQTGNDDEIQTPTGNDEQIDIDLTALAANVNQVLAVATTHSEIPATVPGNPGTPGTPLPFGRVASPVLTIYNNTDPANPVPLFTCDLDEEHSLATAVEMGKIYKNKDGDWMFVAMGDQVGTDAFGLNATLTKFGISG